MASAPASTHHARHPGHARHRSTGPDLRIGLVAALAFPRRAVRMPSFALAFPFSRSRSRSRSRVELTLGGRPDRATGGRPSRAPREPATAGSARRVRRAPGRPGPTDGPGGDQPAAHHRGPDRRRPRHRARVDRRRCRRARVRPRPRAIPGSLAGRRAGSRGPARRQPAPAAPHPPRPPPAAPARPAGTGRPGRWRRPVTRRIAPRPFLDRTLVASAVPGIVVGVGRSPSSDAPAGSGSERSTVAPAGVGVGVPPARACAASRRAHSWNVGQTGKALERQYASWCASARGAGSGSA